MAEYQNTTQSTMSNFGYSMITRSLTVPNNLLSTLQAAAIDSGMAPIMPRYTQPPPVLPGNVYPMVPLILTNVQPMFEKRQMKLLPINGYVETNIDFPVDHTSRNRKENGASSMFLRGGQQSNCPVFNPNRILLNNKPNPTKCCCNRGIKTVWCIMCGDMTKGNVLMICPFHPMNRLLKEMSVCRNSKCKAPGYLIETGWKFPKNYSTPQFLSVPKYYH